MSARTQRINKQRVMLHAHVEEVLARIISVYASVGVTRAEVRFDPGQRPRGESRAFVIEARQILVRSIRAGGFSWREIGDMLQADPHTVRYYAFLPSTSFITQTVAEMPKWDPARWRVIPCGPCEGDGRWRGGDLRLKCGACRGMGGRVVEVSAGVA